MTRPASADDRRRPSALSVVMPAYNELPNLREVLPRLRAVLDGAAGVAQYEVLVVLPPAASEHEQAAVRELGATPVLRGPSDSFGDALRSGFAAAADSDRVITLDADGSHDPVTIPAMLDAAVHADVVVGSRYMPGGSTDNSLPLRIMSKALNLAYGRVLGIKCHDISTNYKMYRRADLAAITLECRDFDVVEEILFRIKALHGSSFRIVEVPDHFHERRHGVTKRRLGPFVVSYLATLVRLRWQTRRHPPA